MNKEKILELIKELRGAEYMSGVTNKREYREKSSELYLEIRRLLYKENKKNGK